jgi:hypothetical protein
MKTAAFWDIVSIIRAIALMREAVCVFETLVYFNETTRCYIPEGCRLHTRRSENLKYRMLRKIGEPKMAEVNGHFGNLVYDYCRLINLHC